MSWERDDEGVKVLNPQNERIDAEDYLEAAVRGSIRWARIDGFRPQAGVESVVKREST